MHIYEDARVGVFNVFFVFFSRINLYFHVDIDNVALYPVFQLLEFPQIRILAPLTKPLFGGQPFGASGVA